MWTTLDTDAKGRVSPGDYRRELPHRGHDRFYDLHVPPAARGGEPLPLVLNLHGGGGNPIQQRRDSGMDAVADAAPFVACYPAGSSRGLPLYTWNIIQGDSYATRAGMDDIGFLRAVLDDVERLLPIDPHRIYATGLSQGGMICYRLACEVADRVAAIAPVAAVLTIPPESCRPARPVPLCHIHGSDDPIGPYRGGVGRAHRDRIHRMSVEESVRVWLGRSGLGAEPSAPSRVRNAELRRYGPGPGGMEVELWIVHGGGHTWPGGRSSLPEVTVGRVCDDIDASRTAWDFFRRHPLPITDRR